MASKYRVMKYDGDDAYSYAVFESTKVKGMHSPIIYGQAKPLVSGCSKSQANSYKTSYEKQ